MSTIEVIGLALMVAGVVLLITEMFIPGFGFPGIAGAVSLIAGICMKSQTVEEGLTYAVFISLGLGVVLALVMIFFKSKKLKSPIKLEESMPSDVNFLGVEDLEYLVGRTGTAATDLRPAGKADIEGVNFDVRSEGPFIARGTTIVIERVQGGSLIVKEK